MLVHRRCTLASEQFLYLPSDHLAGAPQLAWGNVCFCHALPVGLPRLVTLPIAFWAALSGSGLATIAAIAVCGELVSLALGIFALVYAGAVTPLWGSSRLAGSIR